MRDTRFDRFGANIQEQCWELTFGVVILPHKLRLHALIRELVRACVCMRCDHFIDLFIYLFIYLLIGWLVCWLIDCVIDWLVD